MFERLAKPENKKQEAMVSMKFNGQEVITKGKGKMKLESATLPVEGLIQFDYIMNKKKPKFVRKLVFDLFSAKQNQIAHQCYKRAVEMPFELWRGCSVSGKQFNFSKDGLMVWPSRGVLVFEYVIQELEVDVENMDGSYALMLEHPW